MEINHYGDTILGAVVVEDVVEGRMLCLTAHTESEDFGSLEDLPGARLPRSTTEASQARYIVAFAQDNRPTPFYQTNPSFDYALRYGFDQSANAPFNPGYVYLTHPGNQDSMTIYAGSKVLLFGEGIYTVTSGNYIYSAAIEVPGSSLTVENTAGADRGKLKYSTSNVVAEVVHFDGDDSSLTFKILH